MTKIKKTTRNWQKSPFPVPMRVMEQTWGHVVTDCLEFYYSVQFDVIVQKKKVWFSEINLLLKSNHSRGVEGGSEMVGSPPSNISTHPTP